jgi:hypothetical protein
MEERAFLEDRLLAYTAERQNMDETNFKFFFTDLLSGCV